eukprot:14827805-Ditylum_brightwellii.AAC.1
MTGETVLKVVREHRWSGTEDPPFANVRLAMDNWFTSKPLYDKLLRLRTKKPTNATPKGSL